MGGVLASKKANETREWGRENETHGVRNNGMDGDRYSNRQW